MRALHVEVRNGRQVEKPCLIRLTGCNVIEVYDIGSASHASEACAEQYLRFSDGAIIRTFHLANTDQHVVDGHVVEFAS